MQIRHKLAIQFSLIVALLLFLALLLIYYLFNNQLKAEFYKGLESKALMTAEMLVKHTSLTPEVYSRTEDNSNETGLPSKEKIIIYNERFEKVYAFNKSDVVPEYVLEEYYKIRYPEV
jgi:sensor histidine kinase regulating citrate/malate metabolism